MYIHHELLLFLYEGVCMSAFVMSKVDENDLDILNQLEEMYQVLSCMKFPFSFCIQRFETIKSGSLC